MKALFITFVTMCSFISVSAQDADRVKELEQRVVMLEERMARLEERMAKAERNAASSQQTNPAQTKMMKVARQRVAIEREKFKAEDIANAEELYGKASQMYQDRRMNMDDECKKLLDSVVSIYPQLNRAGCAQLYRAQHETGAEKELLLKDCMKRFSGCYYLDGAQVGPLAMLQLAYYYQQAGRENDARNLFKRIRNESPEAVGHDGLLLVSKIE